MSETKENIIYFDGVCILCQGTVNFLLKRDKNDRLKFASLQSEFAKSRLDSSLTGENMETIVLEQNGKFYQKSTAVLLSLKELGFPWNVLYVFRLVPYFLRDAIYTLVGKHRYKWFGKTAESCELLTEKDRSKIYS